MVRQPIIQEEGLIPNPSREIDSENKPYQQRIEELTETGRQLGERRSQLRNELASEDGASEPDSQRQDLQRQIDEISAQISENLQNRMDVVEKRIWELWEPRLTTLQLRKDDLDWAIDAYDTIEESVKVFIGGIDKLKAQRQEVMQRLQTIGEQMRSDGVQEQIFRLQKEYRILEIAYSAEKGKITPTNSLRGGGKLNLDSETNHLAWTSKPTHRPFLFSDSHHPGDDMAVYVEGGDGVDYENVSAILANSSDLPKGINAPVISVFDAKNDGVYSTSDGVVRVASSRRSARRIERTSWHEGGHAIHYEYFNSLPEARQKPVIDAYESWLKRQETLNKGTDSIFQKYGERLFQRDFIAPEENLDAYLYCFTEVFAELRALYKFSLTERGKEFSYASLLSCVTTIDDSERAKILQNAEDIYNALVREVFEPYVPAGRINATKPGNIINPSRASRRIRAAMVSSDGETDGGTSPSQLSHMTPANEEASKGQDGKNSRELEAILLPIPEGHIRFYSGIPAGINSGYNCIPLSNEESIECDQLRERLANGEDLSPELRGRYHELSNRYGIEFQEFEMSRDLAEEQRRIGPNGKVFYVDIPGTELLSLGIDDATVKEEWVFVPWRIANEAKEFPNNLLNPELVNTFWTPGKSSENLEDSNSFKFDNETKEESLAHYNLSEHAYLRYTIQSNYGQRPGINVLELGPHSSNTIPDNLHESAIYTAVDYTHSALEAQRKYAAHALDNVLRVKGDTFHLPIQGSSQDLVVATYHDPLSFGQLLPRYVKQAINEVVRVLKVGGDFILAPWVYKAHPEEINEYLMSKFDLIEEKPDYPGSTSILLVLRKKDGTDGDGFESEPPPQSQS